MTTAGKGLYHRVRHLWRTKVSKVPLPSYDLPDVPVVATWCRSAVRSKGVDIYPSVLAGPSTILGDCSGGVVVEEVLGVLQRLQPDDYIRYTSEYYREGLQRFGRTWVYADIMTVLQGLSKLAQPSSYLEIGVRRGRSLAVVVSQAPACDIVGFDWWEPDYAGMPNPGPDFVRTEMRRIGHTGKLDLISGDSHRTVPAYLKSHPDAFFDLITVDGDHTEWGASLDLHYVLPRLKVGGVIVLDDIAHPLHPHLSKVWRRMVVDDARFATRIFDELGYGVAFGIRRW